MKKFKNFLQLGAAAIALASTMVIGPSNSNANNAVNLDEIESPVLVAQTDTAVNLDNIQVPGFDNAVNLDTIDYPMAPAKLDLPEDKIEKVVITDDIPKNVDLMAGWEIKSKEVTNLNQEPIDSSYLPSKLDLPTDEIKPVVINLDKESTLGKIKAMKKSQETNENTTKLKM